MKKLFRILVLAMLALSLVACGAKGDTGEKNAPKNAGGVTEEKTEEKTGETTENKEKKEISGNLVLYTSQPEADAQKLIDGFNSLYPDVVVDVFRSGTEEVVSKILAEKEAGVVQGDLLLVADNVTFESLKAADLLEPYESKELKGIPEDYVDKDHMYTGTKVITTGIVYNTNLIKEPVKGFSSLTGEAFKGNGIMPSPLYSGAAAYNLGVITRNDALGWPFYEALKAGGITVDKGNGAVQKAVVAGEKAWGILVDYMANRSKKEGAPVEFVYPEEGSPAVTEPIGIVKGTKNPDAAKAFVDYVLSEEGQKLAASLGYTPVKEGVTPPEGLKGISEIKQMTADPKTLLDSREKDKAKFGTLFQ